MAYPALVSNSCWSLTAKTNSDDMGGRIVKPFRKLDKFLLIHLLDEMINRHSRDELIIADSSSIGQSDDLLLSLDFLHCASIPETLLLRWKCVRDGDPDASCTITGWETEGRVGTPVAGYFVEDEVLGHQFDIGGCDALA
jgi:hypothetical protein